MLILRGVLFSVLLCCASKALALEPAVLARLFATKPDYPFAELSPNGERLASAMLHDGVRQLVLITLADKSIQVGKIQGDVLEARWLDDERLVVLAQNHYRIPQLYLVDKSLKVAQLSEFDGSEGFQNRVAELLPQGAYRDGELRLYFVDYNNGRVSFNLDVASMSVKPGRVFDDGNDHELRGTHHGFEVLEEWQGNRYQVNTYQDGEKQETLFSGDRLETGASGIIAYLAAEHQLLATRLADDRETVWRYDIKTKQFITEVLRDGRYDVAAEALYLPYEKAPFGFAYFAEQTTLHYMDPKLATIMRALGKALPGMINVPVSASRDRQRLIIHSSSSQAPGTYYLYRADTRKLEPLLVQAEWLEALRPAASQLVRFPARDGLEIEAYLTAPNDVAAPPLIVMPHGGPHLRDTGDFNSEVQYLVALGYAVIQPNYRGSEGYGERFLALGYGEVGKTMQTDLYDSIKWAQSKGYGTGNRVAMVGGSFGGYAAVKTAVDQPDLIRCAVSMVGFYDVPKLLEADRDKWFYPLYLETYGDPDRHAEALRAMSVLPHIDALRVPLLIAHGAQDERVEVEQAADLLAALARHRKTYVALIREDEGHGFHLSVNYRNYLLQMAEFLQNHLPIGNQPAADQALYHQAYALRNAEADRTLKRIFGQRERRASDRRCVKEVGSNRCKR